MINGPMALAQCVAEQKQSSRGLEADEKRGSEATLSTET